MIDKSVATRIATIEGHIKAIRKMIESDAPCVEVITQLKAVEKAVKKASVIVLKNHLNSCVKDSIAAGENESVIDEFDKLLEMYL